jgi:hypothetical protein
MVVEVFGEGFEEALEVVTEDGGEGGEVGAVKGLDVVEGGGVRELAAAELADDGGGFGELLGFGGVGEGAEFGDFLGNLLFGEGGGEAGDFDDIDGADAVGEDVEADFVVNPGVPFLAAPRAGEVTWGKEGEEEVGVGDAAVEAVLPIGAGGNGVVVFIEEVF